MNNKASVALQGVSKNTKNTKKQKNGIAWKRAPRRGVVAKKKINYGQFFRKAGLFIRYWIGVLVMFAIIASPFIAWKYFEEHIVFSIDRVVIFGDIQYLPQEDLKEITQLALHKNFIGFDVSEFQHIIQENPWVDSVKVTRKWFSELEVTIKERKPIAIWNYDYLIDAEGSIFKPEKIPDQGFALLIAPEGYEKKVLLQLESSSKQLAKIHLKIAQLTVNTRLSWNLVLDNHIELILGTEDFDTRLNLFINHFSLQFADKIDKIKSIDLRYTGGFAVKWYGDET